MTDTNEAAANATGGAALSDMKIPQLQALASELGVSGTGKMRKSDLVTAIENGGVVPAKDEPTGADASGNTSGDRAKRAKEAVTSASDDDGDSKGSDGGNAKQGSGGQGGGKQGGGNQRNRNDDEGRDGRRRRGRGRGRAREVFRPLALLSRS